MTSRRVCRLVLRTASLARRGTSLRAGMAIVARMPMIAMTMINSSSVKPRSRSRMAHLPFSLPITVAHSVETDSLRQGVDIVNVAAAPGARIRSVVVAAQPPLVLAGHRIDGDAAQELQLLVDLAGERDPFDQGVELGRIALGADVDGDHPGVAVTLVFVDRGAHLAQVLAQLHLLEPAGGELDQRQGDRREQHEDGRHHDQLGQGVARLQTAAREGGSAHHHQVQPEERPQTSRYGFRRDVSMVSGRVRSGSTGWSAASSACVFAKSIRDAPAARARKVRRATVPSPLTPGAVPRRLAPSTRVPGVEASAITCAVPGAPRNSPAAADSKVSSAGS